jgi:hypothetical protein
MVVTERGINSVVDIRTLQQPRGTDPQVYERKPGLGYLVNNYVTNI